MALGSNGNNKIPIQQILFGLTVRLNLVKQIMTAS